MKVAVIGSRSLCTDIAPYIPPETTEIITGSMPGVGALAEYYADSRGLPKLVIKLNHLHEGEQEREWRGDLIIDAADFVVAIWDGKSAGTNRAIKYAREAGKPMAIHVINDVDKKA